jgi:hypothetical protein
MGRKSAAKNAGQAPPPAPTAAAAKRAQPLVWGAVIIAALAVAGAVMLRSSPEPDGLEAAAAAPAAGTAAPGALAPPEPDPAAVARAAELAKLGPREQSNLPPIPVGGYAPPRPQEVVQAAYEFAAEHPEVLSYVPCYCGCEQAGHQGNHDCFVKSRAENGDVVEWDEHGIACTVCIDVANRSRQLYASGASVRDIRAAIEKEFAPVYPGKMIAPHPPAAHGH